MRILRILWTAIAVVFTVLLLAKFIMSMSIEAGETAKPTLTHSGSIEETNQSGEVIIEFDSKEDLTDKLEAHLTDLQRQGLPTIIAGVGLIILLYLLFALEGLQVAGLLLKDLDEDAILHFLEQHPVASSKKILKVHRIFHMNFDGFVVGRQLFVIGTVVAMAFINKAVQLPDNATDVVAASLPMGTATASWAVDFVNGGVFAFVTSTLIPSWISQLLPQFWADGRAVSFIALPGTSIVLQIAMLLDKIQLGEPSQVMIRVLRKLGVVGQRQLVPIGKRTYYEASLNFYGKAKKYYEIDLILGNPTTVKEKVTYLMTSCETQHFEHRIELTAPIKEDIEVNINLPENIFAQITAHDMVVNDRFIYALRIELNQPLPRHGFTEDEVTLEIEYQTQAYKDEPGIASTAEFTSSLPVCDAKISIQGKNYLLKQPEIRIVEEVDGKLHPVAESVGAKNWEMTQPQDNNNLAQILLHYPIVATVYQIEFQTMDVPWENGAKMIEVEVTR